MKPWEVGNIKGFVKKSKQWLHNVTLLSTKGEGDLRIGKELYT